MRYQDYIGKEMEIVSKSSYIRGIIKSDGNLSLNKFTNKEKGHDVRSGRWSLSWRTNNLDIMSYELKREGYLVFIDKKLKPEFSSVENIFELSTLLVSLD